MADQQQGALRAHRRGGRDVHRVQDVGTGLHVQQLLRLGSQLFGLLGSAGGHDQVAVPGAGVPGARQHVADREREPHLVHVLQRGEPLQAVHPGDHARLQGEVRDGGGPGRLGGLGPAAHQQVEDRALDVEAGGDPDQRRDPVAAEAGLRLHHARPVRGQDHLGVRRAEPVAGGVQQRGDQPADRRGVGGRQRRGEDVPGLHERRRGRLALGGDADHQVAALAAERLHAELRAVEELLDQHRAPVGERGDLLLPLRQVVRPGDQPDGRTALQAGRLHHGGQAERLQHGRNLVRAGGERGAHRRQAVLGEQFAQRRLVVQQPQRPRRVHGQPEGLRLLGDGDHGGLLAEVQDAADLVRDRGLPDQPAQPVQVGEIRPQHRRRGFLDAREIGGRLQRRIPDRPHLETEGDRFLYELRVRLHHQQPIVRRRCSLNHGGPSLSWRSGRGSRRWAGRTARRGWGRRHRSGRRGPGRPWARRPSPGRGRRSARRRRR